MNAELNATVAKVRAVYGKRLTDSDYTELESRKLSEKQPNISKKTHIILMYWQMLTHRQSTGDFWNLYFTEPTMIAMKSFAGFRILTISRFIIFFL